MNAIRLFDTAEQLVSGLNLPVKREDPICPSSLVGKLTPTSRRKFYCKKLRDLGMDDGLITCLLSDLAWDAVQEYVNKWAPIREKFI